MDPNLVVGHVARVLVGGIDERLLDVERVAGLDGQGADVLQVFNIYPIQLEVVLGFFYQGDGLCVAVVAAHVPELTPGL